MQEKPPDDQLRLENVGQRFQSIGRVFQFSDNYEHTFAETQSVTQYAEQNPRRSKASSHWTWYVSSR